MSKFNINNFRKLINENCVKYKEVDKYGKCRSEKCILFNNRKYWKTKEHIRKWGCENHLFIK